MALDLLGLMGSAICDINVHMKSYYTNKESLDNLDTHMATITENYFSSQSKTEDVIDWESPHRWTAEYLAEQNIQDESLQVIGFPEQSTGLILTLSQSSLGYFLVTWGTKICHAFDTLGDDDLQEENAVALSLTAYHLSKMMTDPNWAADDDL